MPSIINKICFCLVLCLVACSPRLKNKTWIVYGNYTEGEPLSTFPFSTGERYKIYIEGSPMSIKFTKDTLYLSINKPNYKISPREEELKPPCTFIDKKTIAIDLGNNDIDTVIVKKLTKKELILYFPDLHDISIPPHGGHYSLFSKSGKTPKELKEKLFLPKEEKLAINQYAKNLQKKWVKVAISKHVEPLEFEGKTVYYWNASNLNYVEDTLEFTNNQFKKYTHVKKSFFSKQDTYAISNYEYELRDSSIFYQAQYENYNGDWVEEERQFKIEYLSQDYLQMVYIDSFYDPNHSPTIWYKAMD